MKFIISGLVSFIVWGFVPVVLRNLQDYEVNEIITFRMFFASLITCIILLFSPKEHKKNIIELHKQPKSMVYKTYFLTFIGSICVTLNWLSYVYVINNVSMNAGAFAYLILPIVTAFLATIFLKESLSLIKWIGISLGLISCFILGNINPDQMPYISVVTLTYAVYLITQRINPWFNRRLLLAFQFTFGSLIMFIVNDVTVVDKPSDFWINILILAGVFTVVASLLNLYALKGIESSQLAFMIYLNPIITFILGVTMYNETIHSEEIIAFIILFFAILCFNWKLFYQAFNRKSIISA